MDYKENVEVISNKNHFQPIIVEAITNKNQVKYVYEFVEASSSKKTLSRRKHYQIINMWSIQYQTRFNCTKYIYESVETISNEKQYKRKQYQTIIVETISNKIQLQ